MTSEPKTLISIVSPVYNESENIDRLYQAITHEADKLKDQYDFEFLFTDNCSEDDTFEKLAKLAETDSRIRVIRFSRNFGYQRSILTGYLNARGQAAIQLDADLQDPPSMISEFLEEWRNGYDVVYGVRRGRDENPAMEKTRKLFYWVVDALSEQSIPRNAGDFRLVGRRVIEELRRLDGGTPYIRGTISEIGFAQIGIPYKRDDRTAGKTKFNFTRLITFAIDGILNHSILPLRLAAFVGIGCSIVTLLGIFYYSFWYLIGGADWPAGFATTTVLLLFSISLNALFLGIIGEYLGRLYINSKGMPITIIDKEIDRNSPSGD